MRLRSTAEQEEIDGVHSEGVYEIVPSVSCIDESTSLTQSTCADVFSLDESVDSTSQVLVSVTMSASLSFEVEEYDISRAYFQGTLEKLIYI